MERRDILKDQIEQFGRVLGQLISQFLGLKAEGKILQAIEQTNKNLKSKLDIDIGKIINSDHQELSNYLESRKLHPENLERLIDYLIEIGEYKFELNDKEGIRIFKRVLEMYQILDTNSNLYSFNRVKKEDKIKSLLK